MWVLQLQREVLSALQLSWSFSLLVLGLYSHSLLFSQREVLLALQQCDLIVFTVWLYS